MRVHTLAAAVATALLAPLAACASNGPAPPAGYGAGGPVAAAPYPTAPMPVGYRPVGYPSPPMDDGLLPAPPADARPGQCFAKVVVPGQPIFHPPGAPHLTWVQEPPPPGAIGPLWCPVWAPGYQPPPTFTPERQGWIRVICDQDATPEKIGHIQHRLHDWGYYQGGYGGHYDAVTAAAVSRFQAGRHIEHGGYLSYRTMDALEAAPPQGYAPAGPAYPQPPLYPAPSFQPPGYGGPAQGYANPYPAGGARHWLLWSGKASY